MQLSAIIKGREGVKRQRALLVLQQCLKDPMSVQPILADLAP